LTSFLLFLLGYLGLQLVIAAWVARRAVSIQVKLLLLFVLKRSCSQDAEAPSFSTLQRRLCRCVFRATADNLFADYSFIAAFISYYLLEHYTYLSVCILYTFWVPQIYVNVRTGTTAPMRPSYILVTSAAHLFVPLCTCTNSPSALT
jgi:hypothetical protein